MTAAPRVHIRALAALALALAALLVPAQPVFAADSIYWSNGGSPDAIRVGNLDGSGAASDLFLESNGSPLGVAIDPAAGKIYWSRAITPLTGAIQVANLDGSGETPNLITEPGGSGPHGVAIDPAAGKIYWANNANAIRVRNLDGSGASSTLFTEPAGSGPQGVAIDPAAGKIYWANKTTSTIRVGNLDGSGAAATLFTEAGGSGPQGVAIDAAAGKIYWANTTTNTIRVASLDGSGAAATLYTEAPGSSPVGLAIDPAAGKIYWANSGVPAIRVANLDGSGAAATLFTEAVGSAPAFPALLRSPVGSGAPVIFGAAQLGQQLSCSQGSWASDLLGSFLSRAPASFAFQWQRDGADVAGATSSTYPPTQPGAYSCRVTATNQAGSSSQTSGAVAVSAPPSQPSQPSPPSQPKAPNQPSQPKAPKHPKNHHHKGAPGLTVTLTASTSRARPSSVIGYRIVVANGGDATARKVTVCDEPPAEQRTLRTMPAATGSKSQPCWHLKSLAAGAQRVFRMTAMVAANSGTGVQRNSVSVEAANVKGVRTDSTAVRVNPLPETACGSRLARPQLVPRTNFRC